MAAPNEVIWKQTLYFLVFDKKGRESGVPLRSNDCSGSGGGVKNSNFTVSFRQPIIQAFLQQSSMLHNVRKQCPWDQ